MINYRSMLGLVSVCVMLGSLPGCGDGSGRSARVADRGSAGIEYAVYSSVIDSLFIRSGSKRIVISDHTYAGGVPPVTDPHSSDDLEKLFPSAPAALLRDFLAKNERSYPLSRRLDLRATYDLLSMEGFQSFFRQNPVMGWDMFYARYPDSPGFLTLSRVGFDAQQRHALLYITQGCGSLCGEGRYLLLRKQEDTWVIVEDVMTWIS